MAQGRFQTWILVILHQLMAHIYKYKHISNASNHYQCLQVVRALMTKTPVKLEAMLGH